MSNESQNGNVPGLFPEKPEILPPDPNAHFQINIGIDPVTNQVKLIFGKAISWLALEPLIAIQLGQALIQHGHSAKAKSKKIITLSD